MEQLFITDLKIKKVRHLKDISIPLSKGQIKHLILTGKNGSGKTSVIESIAFYLNKMLVYDDFVDDEEWLLNAKKSRDDAVRRGDDAERILKLEEHVRECERVFESRRAGLDQR